MLIALGGGALALARPGWQDARLTPEGRALFAAIATAVLDGLLSADAQTRQSQLDAHLSRLEATVAGLHPIARAQVRQLTALLLHPLGRRLLAGLDEDWPKAAVATVAESLQAMRVSSLALRQQAFQALRELTNGAYFAHPETWGAIGYPGPLAL